MDAAAEIGYVPNHHARALITGRSGAIGLVLPDVANPFFPPLIRYAQLAAEDYGLAVFVADTAEDTKRELQMIERLSPQVEGLIIASSRLPDRVLRDGCGTSADGTDQPGRRRCPARPDKHFQGPD